MSAITSSARSCPSVMKRIFHLLRTLSVKQFPGEATPLATPLYINSIHF